MDTGKSVQRENVRQESVGNLDEIGNFQSQNERRRMAHIIMIHGSWSGGWMWDRVIPILAAAGHSAEAPTLLGADPGGTRFPSRPIAAWADQIAARVRKAAGPVVLVAQSRGGLVISEVAERVPERVGYLVYAAAFLLPDGASLGGTIQSAHPGAAPIFSVDTATGMTAVLPEALEKIYSKTPAHWIEVARAKQCLEPLAAIATPISVSDERFGSVPRAYIEATEDQVMPLTLQRSMQARLPCDPVYTIASDHVLPSSAPDELARRIVEIANRVDNPARLR
ncbi:alpha/beta fold hydrolase [Bradyrhizobium liaoningense]|uniref:alpha/beta fold hydrolase n=1 Tax=Bradyrhizobium liaoningense TaxID=43992 RepID=UPI001BA8FF64|nr:alpha/beta hydrolase [Bradyrhizobium liaoningense]MBR0823766.1 alpha/beta hydrolase [Bradyrhizobium liaoningense]